MAQFQAVMTRTLCPVHTPVPVTLCAASQECAQVRLQLAATSNTVLFWVQLMEKTLESPLDRKEIQPVHPKGDQSWVFIGRTDAEAETPILWPPHAKS